MDELITGFLEEYFTPELKAEIYRSFRLFDVFEYNEAYAGFIDILTEESEMGIDSLYGSFVDRVNVCLNYMLDQHTIKTTDEATISDKNDLLDALYAIQHQEDYSSIAMTLESFEPDIDNLATIISDLSTLDEVKVHELIVSFNSSILIALKTFVDKKENGIEEPMDNKEVIDNIKLYSSWHDGQTFANVLIDNDMLIGARFVDYLPYLETNMVTDDDDYTTDAILSVIYMSTDGFKDPLTMFKTHSDRLIHDLNRIGKIEAKLINRINMFDNYKKALDEKARIS